MRVQDKYGASSNKLDCVAKALGILNFKGHLISIIGSKGVAILLNRYILPFGGVTLGRVCVQPAKQACLQIFTRPTSLSVDQ